MSYRGPALQHIIRKGTTNNETGDSFVITIPSVVANQFQDCLLRIYVSGTSIIMESGCKLTLDDINTHKQNCYYGVRGYEYSASGRKVFIK